MFCSKSRLGGPFSFNHACGALVLVFLNSRLGLPVLVLLHSCLWTGVFSLLNARLRAPPFCFEFKPPGWCCFLLKSRLGVLVSSFFTLRLGVISKKPNTGAPKRDFKTKQHQRTAKA